MMARLFHAAAAALGVLVAACSSDPAHFYMLSATATPATATSTLTVAVGPVLVPAAVDRPQIVVSTGANQVSIDDFNRWAAPLQDNLVRVVAENLATILGTPRVTLYPTLATNVDYRVQIDIRNFESAPAKYALLDAVWTVRRMKDGKSETGRTSVRETITESGYDALAAAHSRGVARMSQDIATAVRALEGAAAAS
jgi:uncharacterized lipoprotein YmbA